MSVVPSPDVLASWQTVEDACSWSGADTGTRRAFCRLLGDPDLSSLMVLAVVPPATVDWAMNQATKGGRPLTTVEKSQLVIMMASVKAKFGAMPNSMSVGGIGAGTGSTAGDATAPSASMSTKAKLKLSQILDQGSDQETEMLPLDTLQKMRRNFVMLEGDNPLEQEEVTDAQLSCLYAKLQSQQTPFVDMGVFGPYGDRIARAMKFVSQQWKDGQWKAVELPGASNLETWEQSWRIFRTACLMLGVATSAVLDRYAAEFRQRVNDHPGVWHLAAQADIRCRSEFWPQELRRQQAFHESQPQLSAYVPEMPWNSVIKASANNREYWNREFEKPALMYSMQGAKATPAKPTPPGMIAVSPDAPNPTAASSAGGDKKRSFDPQRKDGRYFKSRFGVNICYAWSRSKDGCSNTKCERGMAHVCEFCRQPHRTVDCPAVPGWDPTTKTEKNKGRGKGAKGPKRRHMWQMEEDRQPLSVRAVLSEKLAEAKERFQRKLVRKLEFKMHKSSKAIEPRVVTGEAKKEEGDTVFLELFAGEAGLTKAVQKLGFKVMEPGDINVAGNVKVNLDLLNNNHFKAIKKLVKSKKVRWLHAAPPCKTFSRARRSDGLMRLKRLRSEEHPEGLEPKSELVKEANLLAGRAAQLALLQYKAGGAFTLENPETSLIWKYKPVQRLLKLEGVKLYSGDQCEFNGEYKKPTSWLGWAPFAEVLCKRCRGEPEHDHPALQGFTVDFWGQQVWKTALAAEYPQGLCEELARAYGEWVEENPERKEPWQLKMTEEKRGVDPFSKKLEVEEENEACVGGLRNPWKAMAKLPGWRKVGALLRRDLGDLYAKSEDARECHALVGTEAKTVKEELLEMARRELKRTWRCGAYPGSGLWSSWLTVLVRESGDPDAWAATWPALGTPLGILEEIPFGGVFPRVQEGFEGSGEEHQESLKKLRGAEDNYMSYNENIKAGEELFSKEIEKGFAEWNRDRSVLENKYGQLIPSAMGLILKEKQDGSVKARLVHDLRRSDVNKHIRYQERLVLPRIQDALEDVMHGLEHRGPGQKVEVWSLDFSDAFKQLPVRHQEKRFLTGRSLGGFFVYHTVLFGIRTGPLVWGRVASLISRCTQAVLRQGRLQVYVDDPFLTLVGDKREIEKEASLVVLLWAACGLKIAFNKGTRGCSTEWVGARFQVDNEAGTLEIKVPAEKIADWLELAKQLDGKPVVSFKTLERFVGKLNWAAGFVLQLRPFVRMLHAALSRSENRDMVYFRQIEPALRWLRNYLEDSQGGLRKLVKAHVRHRCRLDIIVDASPIGGGAVRLVDGKPVETFSLVWNQEDEKRLSARIGDPASQALWEAYMMLWCLWHWLEGEDQGFVRIRGDAQGVLSALIKRSAASPLLNNVVKEVALHLALHHQTLEAIHLWSESNVWADMLSRGECPQELARLPRVANPKTRWHSWWKESTAAGCEWLRAMDVVTLGQHSGWGAKMPHQLGGWPGWWWMSHTRDVTPGRSPK